MSALGIKEENQKPGESYFGTKNPILATTLGTLGFEVLRCVPVTVVASINNIISLVDYDSGHINDCAHVEMRFEAYIIHEYYGQIAASDIELAHEIAVLSQKDQRGKISGGDKLRLHDLLSKWDRKKTGNPHWGNILLTVQNCYDQITNFLVLCNTIQELSKNPQLEYAKKIGKGEIAYSVAPLEFEPAAQRRAEKFMKGDRHRGHF